MPNNYLSVLYKHIIHVENKNVGLKVGEHKHTIAPPPPPPPPASYANDIYIWVDVRPPYSHGRAVAKSCMQRNQSDRTNESSTLDRPPDIADVGPAQRAWILIWYEHNYKYHVWTFFGYKFEYEMKTTR